MRNRTIINTKEIKDLYKEDCKENGIKFQEEDFTRFLKFLEIDFYDWVRSNLRYFD